MEKIHYKPLKIVFNHDTSYDELLTLKTKYLFTKMLKNTYREKIPTNKPQTLTKSINIDIWANKLNQQFIRDSYTQL